MAGRGMYRFQSARPMYRSTIRELGFKAGDSATPQWRIQGRLLEMNGATTEHCLFASDLIRVDRHSPSAFLTAGRRKTGSVLSTTAAGSLRCSPTPLYVRVVTPQLQRMTVVVRTAAEQQSGSAGRTSHASGAARSRSPRARARSTRDVA